jgi:hypothetical protein
MREHSDGVPSMAKNKRGQQKGAPQHAEGEHGAKTKARIREIVQSGGNEPAETEPQDRSTHADPASQRLFSRRAQHDEAEANSEKTRLSRDIDRHGHVRENFQVPGGAESHPVTPRRSIAPEEPDRPNPNDGLAPEETPDRI